MSMHRLSAGAGYAYLLRHTACGDVQRASSTPLTEYYAEIGYPPGRWLGKGLKGVGLSKGATVEEQQMASLYGGGRHPGSGEPLGLAYPQYTPLAERIRQRIAALPTELSAQDRADFAGQITRAENNRPGRHAVSGFDLTFTVPKSVSVLWAIADPQVQTAIAEAHQAAVHDALEYFEDRALFTRTGKGGCAQVPTRGMLATAFDHWDTRTGDPNLHTHVVIANKVQGADGKWRSLDSRSLHHAAVAVSELYDDLIADHVAARVPVSWGWRDRGERRTPAYELDGVDDSLLTRFSSRSGQVANAMRDRLLDFEAEHGRSPTRVEVLQLRQQATRATRPNKTLTPLPELMSQWRRIAREHSGRDLKDLATRALIRRSKPVRFEDIPADVLQALAGKTLEAVMERRSTWTPWNVQTETYRATRGLRMASTADRTALADAVADAVLQHSVALDPPQPVPLPAAYLDQNGHSVFSRPGERKFSHPRVLEAEQRLLDANSLFDAPRVPVHVAQRTARVAHVAGQSVPVQLAADQVDAVITIATSGRALEVLVGPAGTGKTTTLCALRSAWETRHGLGSVIGLAPSSTAAHELAASLSIPCENTAKWLYETTGAGGVRRSATLERLRLAPADTRRQAKKRANDLHNLHQDGLHWRLHPGQLLIVDEASLAGTLALDQLRQQTEDAGAKLLLVGDHRQLTAVDAGGAFGLLAEHGAATELRSLWRFQQPWEAAATRRLRRGDPDVLDTYAEHERISSGPAELMIEQAYQGWQASDRAGEAALLVAADSASVTALNQRAHDDRVQVGLVHPVGIPVGDGNEVSIGDRIVTRRNDRQLLVPGGGHVRNGALWYVVATRPDGSMIVTPADRHVTHGCTPDPTSHVTLPEAYVREHVELGYATTAHRAQGLTVDTCHTLVTPGMAREAFYVAMTRGRAANLAYVSTDNTDPACEEIPDQHNHSSGRQVLEAVLARAGAELSATQTIQARQREATSLTTLLPIRDTLTSDADLLRWEPVLRGSILTTSQVESVLDSPAQGALLATLRRGEQSGQSVESVLNVVITQRPLDGPAGARDLAAVLHERLTTLPDGAAVPVTAVIPVVSDQHRELLDAIVGHDCLIDARLAEQRRTEVDAQTQWDEQAWRSLVDAEELQVPQR